MHFSLVKINPENAQPSHGFDDVILPLYYTLRRLGYRTEIRFNSINQHSRNIVFGSCISPRRTGRMLPKGSIIFNLEQINMQSKWCNPDYMAHLHDFTVWDYSAANIHDLAKVGITDTLLVPLGYVPEMTRLRDNIPQEIDVLFYGLLTERRHQIISTLLNSGVQVIATQEAFGDLRDKLLSRTRIVLNLHNYAPAKLEVVRLGYVWANKKAVVSERGSDTEVPAHLEAACLYAPPEGLAETITTLLADTQSLSKLAQQGFDAFSAQPMADTLEALLGRRVFSGAKRNLTATSTHSSDTESGLQSGVDPNEPDDCSQTPCQPYHLRPVEEWLITKDRP